MVHTFFDLNNINKNKKVKSGTDEYLKNKYYKAN